MRAFVFGFVGRLTPRDDGHGGTSSESRDVEIFASHAADPTLVTALNLVACEVIAGHDHDDAGHYQTSFGDSAKRCYTLVVVPRGGKDRSDTNTTTLACEDGGPPDHSLVSALASRKRSGALVRVVFGILVASRGSPVSTTPEPDASAAWLDTLRAEFESRYSSGAYVGRTKTIGRGDSYNFDNFTGVLRKHAASFDVDVEHIPGIGLARKKLEDVTATTANNIVRVVNGRERLEDIEERTEDLRETASLFRGESVRVTREIWWRSVRMHCVTAVAVMLGMFVVFLAACGGYGCLH